VYVLAVGPAAYGAGKVVAGAQDWDALVAGLAITAGCVVLGARYIAAQDPRAAARRQRRRGQRGITVTDGVADLFMGRRPVREGLCLPAPGVVWPNIRPVQA